MKKFVSFLFLFLGLSVSVFASDTDDVKKYITELEKKLMNSLEEGTIINIEF